MFLTQRKLRGATGWLPLLLLGGLIGLVGGGELCAQELPQEVERFRLPIGVERLAPEPTAGLRFSAEPARDPLPARAGQVKPLFYGHHLLPRLNRQFAEMGAFQAVPLSADPHRQFVLFDLFAETAEARAERGTRKALGQFLIENTEFGRSITEFRSGHRMRIGDERRTSYGVGVYHGLPRFEVKSQRGAAVMRFGVSPDGSVGFSMRHQANTRAHFHAGYDAGEDRYRMICRLSF